MKESNFQTEFGKNIEDIISKFNGDEDFPSFTFELKIAKDKSIPFNRVETHQIEGLFKSIKGLYHKISDSPYGGNMKFTSKKPFDCMYISMCRPFVVICWYEPRKLKEMHFIDLNTWINERDTSTRKSLTYERSKEINRLIYKL